MRHLLLLSFASSLILLLFGCNDTPAGQDQVSDNNQVAVEQPEVAPALHPRELQIEEKLKAYYQALEQEQIDETEFFTPVVRNFFGKELPRAQIGQSLRNGFKQVDDRIMVMDPATLRLTNLPDGEVMAEFSGQVSFVRVNDGQRVAEPFTNRVIFDANDLMVSYESIATTSQSRSADPLAQGRAAAEEILRILQSGELGKLSPYFASDLSPMMLVKPGAYPMPYKLASPQSIGEIASWLQDGTPSLSTRVEQAELPKFDCDDLFSKNGTFLARLDEPYRELTTMMEDVEAADLQQYSAEEWAHARKVEAAVQVKIIDTASAWVIGLGEINGTWKLLILDLATLDCGA